MRGSVQVMWVVPAHVGRCFSSWAALMAAGESLVGLSQRLPPANLAAEAALLGAILANNKAFHMVAGFLKPDAFADPVHRRIYEECARVILGGGLADAVTMRTRFENSGILDEVGGTQYLAQLLTAMVGIINAPEYGRAINDCWVRRQGIDLGEQLVNGCFGGAIEKSAENVLQEAADKILGIISTGSGRETKIRSIGEAIADRIKQLDENQRNGITDGLATGVPALDARMGPMRTGDLIYLMGIRGSGKTALAVQIAVNVARQLLDDWLRGGWQRDQVAACIGDPNTITDERALKASMDRCPCVLLDSYEMPEQQISDRIISYRTGIQSKVLTSPQWELGTAEALRRVQVETYWLPLKIDDRRGQSAASMAIRGRMVARTRPVVLRITDHIQKVVTESLGDRDNRNDVYRRTSNRWKNDAAQWGRHLVLCHPRADAKRRESGTPTLGDALNGIDDDADLLLALHREEMFIPAEPPPRNGMREEAWQSHVDAYWQRRKAAEGTAKVLCLKNRGGASNWSVNLRWDGPTTSFSEPQPSDKSASSSGQWDEF